MDKMGQHRKNMKRIWKKWEVREKKGLDYKGAHTGKKPSVLLKKRNN